MSDPQAPPDLLAHKVHRATPDLLDQQELLLTSLDLPDPLEHKAFKVIRAQRVLQGLHRT